MKLVALWLPFIACAGRGPHADTSVSVHPSGSHFVLHGAILAGGTQQDVEIDGGKIVAVGKVDASASIVDVTGKWLAPAFIDSHVHLAYLPEGDQLADGGIAAAVDLAAPIAFLSADHAPLQVIAAGPMITAVSGYPTQSWGRNGYGLEVADASAAKAAVDQLFTAGAKVIKVPVTSDPTVDDDTLAAAVAEDNLKGLKVASHALRDVDAARAAAGGVDVLAHTPTEALSLATVDAWAGRAVISTLSAFGGSAASVANLSALRARGLTVLYGTDFGNDPTAGIGPRELDLLGQAGLDGAAILAAGTSTPAAYWGFGDLGSIAPGKAASLLVLDRDPLKTPSTLATPSQVYIAGAARR